MVSQSLLILAIFFSIFFCFSVATLLYLLQSTRRLRGALTVSEESLAQSKLEVIGLRRDLETLKCENLESELQLEKAKSQAQGLEFQLKTAQESYSLLKKDMESLREASRLQFSELSATFLEKQAKTLEAQSQKQLSAILNPVREKMVEFEKSVRETYSAESRERFALKQEIERVVLTHKKLSEESQNLTTAIKGDQKTQGIWGEHRLELILDKSGLTKGSEYTTQASGMGLKSETGASMRPDVVINLPENKHIIVDAKVSLTAFEKFVNTEDQNLSLEFLKDFLSSVKKHVNELSTKSYQNLKGVTSPDFVLMFCPLESAYTQALISDTELISFAWSKRVAIVGPTTLMTTLQTVACLWKTERQNKNALEIARQGGALYDKFVAFLDDMKKIEKSFSDAQKSFDTAMNKLQIGKGNLIKRSETLRELGLKTSKSIDPRFVDFSHEPSAELSN